MSQGNRREFLKRVGSGVMIAGVGSHVTPVSAAEAQQQESDAIGPVETRTFGRIGSKVSILGLGLGSAFTRPYQKDPEKAHELLRQALSYGVTYWDTARAYGQSENLIGPVVPEVRDKIFLVSKSAKRDYDGFMRELETSLKNLRTDHLDLYHIHNLNPKRDKVDAIEKGAAKAARKARDEGMIKAFGVTGHSGPDILMQCIKRFDPDALLTIFPADRPANGRYEDDLLPLARERKMGVIAMKAVRMARESDLKGTDLIRYPMSLDGVHVTIVGLDNQAHLDANAAMASKFEPLNDNQRAEMTRESRQALAGLIAPWNRPGYHDSLPA